MLCHDINLHFSESILQITTPGDNEFKHVWIATEHNFFKFQVQACADVHIALTQYPGKADNMSYEIVIGASNNSISHVKDPAKGAIVKEVKSPDVLSCTERRPFWIQFIYESIWLGRGSEIGRQGFLIWTHPIRPISALSLASASGYSATWEFNQQLGNDKCCTMLQSWDSYLKQV